MSYKFERPELKFRAWDGERMFYSDKEYGSLTYFFNYHSNDTMMQWTGLKDKDGKDIYEGDILASKGGYTRIVSFQKNSGSFMMAHLNELNITWGDPWQSMPQEYLKEFEHEIVGNLFENPYLIPQ